MTNPRDDLMAFAPCPFCGGEAERIDIPTVGSDPELGGDPNAGGSCISCKRCAASTALHFDRKENLYSSWNDRAASRPAPVDREAVERALIETLPGVGKPSNKSVRDIAVDRVLSLLRPAEPVEAKWRPIETAPKEDPERPGRDFEIIVGGGEIKDESADLLPWRPFDSWSLACYDSMRGCWRGEQTEQYDCFYLHKPTHWMPKFAGPGQCGSTTPDAVSEPVEAEGVREPVAWIITWSDGETSFTRSAPSASSPKNCKYQPLYTHAPKSPDTSAAILAEREMCAAIADEWANKMARNHGRETANTIAAAIRQLPTTERGE